MGERERILKYTRLQFYRHFLFCWDKTNCTLASAFFSLGEAITLDYVKYLVTSSQLCAVGLFSQAHLRVSLRTRGVKHGFRSQSSILSHIEPSSLWRYEREKERDGNLHSLRDRWMLLIFGRVPRTFMPSQRTIGYLLDNIHAVIENCRLFARQLLSVAKLFERGDPHSRSPCER